VQSLGCPCPFPAFGARVTFDNDRSIDDTASLPNRVTPTYSESAGGYSLTFGTGFLLTTPSFRLTEEIAMRTRLRESETVRRKTMLPARAVLEYEELEDRYITFLEVIQSSGEAQYMHGRFFDSRDEAEEDYERRLERL